MKRRDFLSGAVVAAGFAFSRSGFERKSGSSLLSHKERVDGALLGRASTVLRVRSTTTMRGRRHNSKHKTISIFIVRTRRTS
jgi:hypothetical protein